LAIKKNWILTEQEH